MGASEKITGFIERSSWIRKMFEEGVERRKRFGAENVFDFSLGNPDLEPPAAFTKELMRIAGDPTPGLHAYMPNAGIEATRQAVALYLQRVHGPAFSAGDVIMTVGAGGGLNIVFKTLLNPGDDIVIPKPYFVEYDFYLDNHQGKSKPVPTRPDFSLDLEALDAAIGEKTRAVLINSPNNPTGKVYTLEEMQGLAGILERHSRRFGRPVYLLSDEPYRKLVYDGVTLPSIFSVYRDSILVTSFSKDLSLPGERIGYAVVHPEITGKESLIPGMILCNRILGYVNAPSLMQRVVMGLLDETVDVGVYQRRRDRLTEALTSFGYRLTRPQGAFYLFPQSPIPDDVAFVRALQEENILTVPGSGFGGPGHFRIAYCVSETVIARALPGFERVIKRF